jgi:uncharacterized coiled-coil protein SlyX
MTSKASLHNEIKKLEELLTQNDQLINLFRSELILIYQRFDKMNQMITKALEVP